MIHQLLMKTLRFFHEEVPLKTLQDIA